MQTFSSAVNSGKQMMELVDEAERTIALATSLGVGQLGQHASVDLDLAGTERIEAADDVQQCRLARAGRADDGHGLAATQREVHVREDARSQVAFFVDLGDAGGAQDDVVAFGLIHNGAPGRAAYARHATPDRGSRAARR